ncbi:MAG: signal peptidase II [Candidatus Hydrogenedentes bacterium]|nr:signal peptidase II [Candidatus Hydrogenedentota bacterium]
MIQFVSGPRMALIGSILVATVGCDQLTKFIAHATMRHSHGRIPIAGDVFYLQYAENRGGFLSLGASLPESARFWLLTVFTGAILTGIAYVLLTNRGLSRTDVISLGLLLSGGVGNLIDRVFRDGTVVDFMVMGVGPVRTGVFNIADVAVMAGIFLLFASKLFSPAAEEGVVHGTQDS